MSAYTFTIKQGDSKPPLKAQLLNNDDSVINLVDASTVTFTMKNTKGNQIKVNAQSCTIEEDNDGVKSMVSYGWQTNDTDTVGVFNGEFEVTWSGGDKQTFPDQDYVRIIISDKLGG